MSSVRCMYGCLPAKKPRRAEMNNNFTYGVVLRRPPVVIGREEYEDGRVKWFAEDAANNMRRVTKRYARDIAIMAVCGITKAQDVMDILRTVAEIK